MSMPHELVETRIVEIQTMYRESYAKWTALYECIANNDPHIDAKALYKKARDLGIAANKAHQEFIQEFGPDMGDVLRMAIKKNNQIRKGAVLRGEKC